MYPSTKCKREAINYSQAKSKNIYSKAGKISFYKTTVKTVTTALFKTTILISLCYFRLHKLTKQILFHLLCSLWAVSFHTICIQGMFCFLGAGCKNMCSHSTNEHIHLIYCLFVLPGLPVCCECLCPFVLINLLLQIKTSICWRSYLYLSSSLETWATLSHRASAQDMCHMKML